MIRRSMKYIIGLLIIAALLAAFLPPVGTLTVLGLVLAIFFLARNLGFGLLILVFFFPYLGLVIDFGEFEAFREVPYLKDINAPFIDLYGLVLLAAWGFNIVARHFMCRPGGGQAPALHLPHLKPYLLFWLSGLISLLRVPSIYFGTALKYLARPFTFFYLVFFAMPVSILTRIMNHESRIKMLDRALAVFYWTGLLSAFDGLLGLFFTAHPDFPRATPFGFLGVNPLGPNHNLLAETLIATAPAGLLVRCQVSGVRCQNWIRYGMFFQWAIALLTFSRTAWIAVAVQAIVYFVLRGQRTEDRGQKSFFRFPSSVFRHLRDYWPMALAVFLVVVSFFLTTMLSETVRGSTLSRLDQVRIAWFYFLREPLLGQGIGTFIPTLWQTRAFLLDYGEPLEAHGVLFKLMFEQGLLGLATFGIFVGAILREIWKKGNVVALMIAAGSLTYQLFNTTYYTSKLWVPLAIALVISRIRRI